MDLSSLKLRHRREVKRAIAQCDYPFDFSVTFRYGSRWQSHPTEGWTEVIFPTQESGRKVIHELGHHVTLRRVREDPTWIKVFSNLVHDGPCPHRWRDLSVDWNWQPEEAVAELFVLAYSPFTPYRMAPVHRVTKAKARQLREMLTPDLPIPEWLVGT